MPLSITTVWTEILRSTRAIKGTAILTAILKQVVKVFWHKAASPPQTDSSVVFDRWRQCSLPLAHIGATWRIRLNLCFRGPTQFHSPNGKLIGSAVFAQITAECPYILQWILFPRKIAPSHGGSGPPSWANSSSQPKRHLDRFSRFCWAHCCNRQTDRPHDADRSNSLYVCARCTTLLAISAVRMLPFRTDLQVVQENFTRFLVTVRCRYYIRRSATDNRRWIIFIDGKFVTYI